MGSLEAHLQLRNFIHGHKFSAVDVLVISAIRSSEKDSELPLQVMGWIGISERNLGISHAEQQKKISQLSHKK